MMSKGAINMLLIISILFIIVAIMKFFGFNIIHKIKKISTERSENKKKYDWIISLACSAIGIVLLIFYLNASRWLYGFLESELLLDILFVVLFIGTVLMIYAPIAYREGIIGKRILKCDNNGCRKILAGSYVAGILALLLLITLGIIFRSEYGCNLDIYFLGMDTSVVFYILESLIVISVYLIIVIKKHNQKLIIFISTLVTLGVLLFSLFLCVFTTGGDYYTFSSPDRKHSIVIEEWAFLMGEGINVYERENIFFIRKLGTLSGDSQNGYYPIEWKENKVIVTPNMGTENEEICEFVLKNK